MLGTYGTADFDEIIDSLQSAVDRLKHEYRATEKEKNMRINDYNLMVDAFLILERIFVD